MEILTRKYYADKVDSWIGKGNIIVLVGAFATNSMAILSDFIHDMSDTISIALAWALEKVAQKDSTDKYSYGYQRFSILGAVIISVFVTVTSCSTFTAHICSAVTTKQLCCKKIFYLRSVHSRCFLISFFYHLHPVEQFCRY